MAATRLIPMHLQKSRSMGQCLKERTDYAKNDEKTEAGQFVLQVTHARRGLYVLNLTIKDIVFDG